MNSGIPTSDVEIPFSSDIRLGTVNGRLLVALDSGYLASFPSGNQKPEWQTTIQGLDISSIVFLNDKIVAASSDKLIRVISLTDGRSVSSSSVENNVSALNVFEGDVVAGDSRGNLTRYGDDNRTVSWRFRNGARISSVVPTDRGILAASLDNFVYMASSYDGGVRWKKRMAGRVSSIAAVGNIAVVLTIGEPNAVILNLDNGKSAGELSISEDDAFSQPVIIADGRLLFFTNEQILAESSQPCP
jgi:outer membrane protein assembly factor BamB